VLTETVFRIITQRPSYKTFIHPSSLQTIEALTTMSVKEHGYLQVFFRNSSSPLPYKDITAFEGTLSNVCFLPHKMLFVSQIYAA